MKESQYFHTSVNRTEKDFTNKITIALAQTKHYEKQIAYGVSPIISPTPKICPKRLSQGFGSQKKDTVLLSEKPDKLKNCHVCTTKKHRRADERENERTEDKRGKGGVEDEDEALSRAPRTRGRKKFKRREKRRRGSLVG